MLDALAQAQEYAGHGYSIIPLHPRTKIPVTSWKPYQSQAPSPQLVERWWAQHPEANIAIITGPVSRLVVLDLDPRNDPTGATGRWLTPQLPPPTAITGTGGWHWYIQESRPIRTMTSLRPGLDLKAAGGFAVAPPSIHPNGRPYERLGGVQPGLPGFVETLIHEVAERRKGERKNTPRPVAPDEDRLGLGEVLRLLQGVRLAGRGWLARCPAHADGNPSLSIGQRRDGGLLLHCFAGCPYTSVIKALRDRQQIQLAESVAGMSIARD